MEDWREKLGAAFGISADDVAAEAESEASESATAVSAIEQQGKARVNILLDKKGRHGKQATLVTDLNVDDEALKDLARELKTLCGVGGSARGGEILIQGDRRQQVLEILKDKGFNARII